MKKLLLSLFAFCFCFSSFANITLNGIDYTIDTLSMYPSGPGSMFYELRMLRASNGAGRLDCWLMTVDTKNPYVTIEEVLGTGKIIGTERPSAMAARSTTDTKIFFGGTNGDFFVTQGDVGLPVGLTVVNSEFAHTPSAATSRRVGGVDEDMKGVLATNISYSFNLVTSNDTLKIHHVNYKRGENELVLYNKHNASTTLTNAYGTELQAELLPGERWQTTGDMKLKITDKQQNVGSMPLSEGKVVLSGHGTMATALDALNIGDEVIVSMSLLFDGQEVDMAQCIGGDTYALIVNNGQVEQSNFWNENHPRTAFGTSEDGTVQYFLVVDGRGASTGCTTKILGEIIHYYGAHKAVNWDGGGSSCLYVRNLGQMNNGSDGYERACGNGMFAVANVPEVDSVIASIAPYMPIYSLPRYGLALPKFLGYNKYGVMIDTDVQGVTLSCAPELGEILEDGRFLASGEKGGTLYAKLGDITTELEVRLITSAPIAIRLDSVLCDAAHPYTIEVQGTVGNATIDLLASALTWTSLDPEVVSVDESGTIVGVKNGSAMVVGQLGDFKDSILVNVEIPTAHKMIWDDFRVVENWTLKGSSGFNPTLSVPEDASAPVNMLFNYKSARSPYVQFAREAPIYSRPDTIRIPMHTDAIFSKIYATVRANNAIQGINITIEPNQVGDVTLDIPVEECFGTDVAIYPLHFELVKMFLNTSTEVGERYVALPGIQLLYGDADETDVDNVLSSQSTAKFIENGQLFIQRNGKIYTVLGTQK
ncbi:MAG: phosphodiester glycosidase family protein [Paludibacteraceae bacterium]|nr:phosphodiester glycosidase family protein [Paludibacteraceae bacterium]